MFDRSRLCKFYFPLKKKHMQSQKSGERVRRKGGSLLYSTNVCSIKRIVDHGAKVVHVELKVGSKRSDSC